VDNLSHFYSNRLLVELQSRKLRENNGVHCGFTNLKVKQSKIEGLAKEYGRLGEPWGVRNVLEKISGTGTALDYGSTDV
jgi:hypothetical protein